MSDLDDSPRGIDGGSGGEEEGGHSLPPHDDSFNLGDPTFVDADEEEEDPDGDDENLSDPTFVQSDEEDGSDMGGGVAGSEGGGRDSVADSQPDHPRSTFIPGLLQSAARVMEPHAPDSYETAVRLAPLPDQEGILCSALEEALVDIDDALPEEAVRLTFDASKSSWTEHSATIRVGRLVFRSDDGVNSVLAAVGQELMVLLVPTGGAGNDVKADKQRAMGDASRQALARHVASMFSQKAPPDCA